MEVARLRWRSTQIEVVDGKLSKTVRREELLCKHFEAAAAGVDLAVNDLG
jgi:hypothetical protein